MVQVVEHEREGLASANALIARLPLAQIVIIPENNLAELHRLLTLQLDVDVPGPVRVELDGQPGALDADRGEELRLSFVWPPLRHGLLHPPERDPAVGAFELDGDRPEAGLERHALQSALLADDERAAERGMAGERELLHRCEDPDPGVAVVLGRQHEDRLREVHLAREALHLIGREVARVREHGQLIALEGRVGEDVDDEVALHSRPSSQARSAMIAAWMPIAASPW